MALTLFASINAGISMALRVFIRAKRLPVHRVGQPRHSATLAANNAAAFSNDVTGTVRTSTNNQLAIINLPGWVAGSLTAIVTVDGESSGVAIEVANVT